MEFPRMDSTEAELSRQRTLNAALQVQLDEAREERGRIEGRLRQTQDAITTLAEEIETMPINEWATRSPEGMAEEIRNLIAP